MRNILLILMMVVSCVPVFAQHKKKVEQKPAVPVVATPLVYSSVWGPIKNGEVFSVQVVSTLPAPMLVKDNTGVVYTVSGFRINYSFTSTYKDEETQQTKSVKDFRVMDVNNSNKLTNDWIESIKDNIKPGDQILFNKILFRNGSGKLQYAPDLKILVK